MKKVFYLVVIIILGVVGYLTTNNVLGDYQTGYADTLPHGGNETTQFSDGTLFTGTVTGITVAISGTAVVKPYVYRCDDFNIFQTNNTAVDYAEPTLVTFDIPDMELNNQCWQRIGIEIVSGSITVYGNATNAYGVDTPTPGQYATSVGYCAWPGRPAGAWGPCNTIKDWYFVMNGLGEPPEVPVVTASMTVNSGSLRINNGSVIIK
jgi:hypothetical protein